MIHPANSGLSVESTAEGPQAFVESISSDQLSLRTYVSRPSAQHETVPCGSLISATAEANAAGDLRVPQELIDRHDSNWRHMDGTRFILQPASIATTVQSARPNWSARCTACTIAALAESAGADYEMTR